MAELKDLIVNGVDLEAKVNELNTNMSHIGDYIGLTLSSNYTIQSQNVYEKLPMTLFTGTTYAGDTFQYNSDGSITILRDCVVLITGQAYFAIGFTDNDWLCACVCINGSYATRGGATIHDTSPYMSLGSTYIGFRNAGDIVDLRVLNETGARGIIGNANTSTFLRLVALT